MGIFDRNGSGNGHRANGYRRPARYSAFDLIRHGLSGTDWPRARRAHDLRPSYDAVIVGGGVHGLATAYYLAKKHGVIKVAEAGAEVARVAARLAREGTPNLRGDAVTAALLARRGYVPRRYS